MASPLLSVDALAVEVRSKLSVAEPAEAFRVVADWFGRARASGERDLVRAIEDAPATTCDPRWDAMLAGLAEQLCLDRQLPCPKWPLEPHRYLATWWFMTPYPSLHPSAFAEAPSALANRGVFIHRADFESV